MNLFVAAITGGILGGIIGYVTNRLAVWMLFHPKSETRVLGFQLPLTPGLIVKNQEKLADSIGRAVSNDLLDPETLIRHLEEAELESAIEQAFAREREILLQKETPLSGIIDPNNEGHLKVLHDRLVDYATEQLLSAIKQDEEGRSGIGKLFHQVMEPFLDRPIAESFGEAEQRSVAKFIVTALTNYFEEGKGSQTLSRAVHHLMENLPKSQSLETLKDYLRFRMEAATPNVSSRLQEALGEYLVSEEFGVKIRPGLAKKLYAAITEAYPMAAMLLKEQKVEELLTERWGLLSSELATVANGEGVRDYFIGKMNDEGSKWLDSLPERLAEAENRAILTGWISSEIEQGLKTFLKRDEGGEAIERVLGTLAEKTPRQILSESTDGLERLETKFQNSLEKWAFSEKGKSWIRGKIHLATGRYLFERPTKELVGLFPVEEWNQAARILAQFIKERAIRVLPEILTNHLDLEKVVSDKVRAFDSDKIEATIQRVSGRELKGIVRLGGLIGIIVGAIWQVAFVLLTSQQP